MADLKALFAKKASPDVSETIHAKPNEDGNADSSKPTNLPRESEAKPTTTPKPANPFAPRSSGGAASQSEQPVGGTQERSGSDSSGGQPKSGLSALRLNTGTRNAGDDSGKVDAVSLDSLESLDKLADDGIEPSRQGISYFPDETPADKPTRELPEDLTKEQLGFVDMLDSVYGILHDPELLGGTIKNIMVELAQNSEYTKLMSPEDIRVMVRGMRESMGLARVKKQESKAKRSGGGKKSKQLDADMLADLDSMGIEI